VGTLSREQIYNFGDRIENIESYIRCEEVQCITVNDLLGRASHCDPDILVVDAEGFDHVILSQFNRPKGYASGTNPSRFAGHWRGPSNASN
jgi:hypothetical protein